MRKMTLIGMYNYDNSLFSRLNLPDGLETATAINTILREKGEFPSLYSDPDFVKYAIGTWSAENQMSFEHLAKLRKASYDPISNYDRTEEEEAENSGTGESLVSAYDSNEYQPSSKDSSGTAGKRKLHAYGNIGTTTNAQMMLAEREVVEDVNVYRIIADMFADAFCIKVF